jgi:hypothetical protein
VHGGPVGKSEPEHLIDFCERIPEWCVLVALIGNGQAIHVGEEGGVPLSPAGLASGIGLTVRAAFAETFAGRGLR